MSTCMAMGEAAGRAAAIAAREGIGAGDIDVEMLQRELVKILGERIILPRS